MIGFALCHGWAFDAQAMQPLQAALQARLPHAAFACFDLGFYDAPQMPDLSDQVQWIALGHSWGFAWLLQQPIAWRAAVSVNGFTRFCRQPGRPQGTPPRLVDAMLARLEQDAAATVADFRLRCGMPAAAASNLDVALLHEHLLRLRDLDLDLPAIPLLALRSADDAIVAPALAAVCFDDPHCTQEEFDGDHTRLLREPQAAAAAIGRFVEAFDA
jgi:pimeloyl-[acyl-carrier protein] methyl ester esterase